MNPGSAYRSLPGIELLRFVCALSVLTWHYQQFSGGGGCVDSTPACYLAQSPLHFLLYPGYINGHYAVEAFWTISGFIFFRNYADRISRNMVTSYEFLINRFSRLYPLHLVTLLVTAVLQHAYISSHASAFIFPDVSAGSFVFQVFFASVWFYWQEASFNGPVWSVSVEVLVYLVFYIAMRWGLTSLASAVSMALAAYALTRLRAWHLYDVPLITHYAMPCAMCFFAGGAASHLPARPRALQLALAAIAVISALLLSGFVRAGSYSIMLLSAAAIIAAANIGPGPVAAVLGRLAFLGNATYSSYLIHFPMQLLAVLAVDAAGIDRAIFYNPAVFLAYLAAVIASSLAVYRWFERPAQDWIRSVALAGRQRAAV